MGHNFVDQKMKFREINFYVFTQRVTGGGRVEPNSPPNY